MQKAARRTLWAGLLVCLLFNSCDAAPAHAGAEATALQPGQRPADADAIGVTVLGDVQQAAVQQAVAAAMPADLTADATSAQAQDPAEVVAHANPSAMHSTAMVTSTSAGLIATQPTATTALDPALVAAASAEPAAVVPTLTSTGATADSIAAPDAVAAIPAATRGAVAPTSGAATSTATVTAAPETPATSTEQAGLSTGVITVATTHALPQASQAAAEATPSEVATSAEAAPISATADALDAATATATSDTAKAPSTTAAELSDGKQANKEVSKPEFKEAAQQQKGVKTPQQAKDEEKKRPAKKAPALTQIVAIAPAAMVKDGDDIDDDGKCKEEITKLCSEVQPGEGKLAECLSDAISESESGAADAASLSVECREEVFQFKIHRNSNINANVPLAKACKEDAEMYCNVTWFFGYQAGQVTDCLKDLKEQISKPCKKEIFKVMLDGAVDFRSDPVLYKACKEDSESLCMGLETGGGRIQACLRDKRMQLTWQCEEQLFKQEIENADDVRLSVRLFAKCLPDKRKFCKGIEPGNARAKDCLEENREQLAGACKDEIDAMIERRVHDFRLDPKLRGACEEDIFNMCAYYNDLDDIDTYDATVINCLQDFSTEIGNAVCKQQVKKYVSLAAQDIRFDVPLAEACFDDRQKYCGHVPPGSARVMRCLSNKRDQLSPVCRATLFDEEVRFSENIDFQAPMKAACETEMDSFCKRVPHENGRVIRCLQDNKNEKTFGQACREEVDSYEAEIGRDYRLNYRLRTACQKDIQGVCPSICSDTPSQACGGKVLRCLSDKAEELKEEACRKEVAYFEKMEVSDFRNDIILAEACRGDVDKFCAEVQPGEGRVHKCLRDNTIKLSKPCRMEELLLEEKEATSIELSPNLLRACKAERQMYCSTVAAGSARVFRCLAENVNAEDFGAPCRKQIGYKLQRRQSNWRLDPPLRKACRADVSALCAKEDLMGSQDGAVYRCMIRQFVDLSSGCQRELGRALHMAFFAYQPAAVLTGDCDADVKRMCLDLKPAMIKQPGAVGACLANILDAQVPDRLLAAAAAPGSRRLVEPSASSSTSTSSAPATAQSMDLPASSKLSASCLMLAGLAEPPDAKRAFEASLSYAGLLGLLDQVGTQTGLPLTTRGRLGAARGVSLTGWGALAGVAALVLLLLAAAVFLYRRVRGLPDDGGYTLVVKAEPK